MAATNNSQPIHIVENVTILNSATESLAIDFVGLTLIAIITPPLLTSTILEFIVSAGQNESLLDYYSTTGSLVQVPIGTNRYIGITAVDFAPVAEVRLRVDTPEAADRVFQLIARRIA